jgi:phospholipase/carboxylesterase
MKPSVVVGLALIGLSLGCGGGPKESRPQVAQVAQVVQESTTAAVEPSATAAVDFAPPDAEGWGRAAGLRYLERCLGPCAKDAAVPLAILIHGLGDRPRPDWLPSAANIETPVRLIMPQAPTPFYQGFAWFPYRIRGNNPVALARGIAGAADHLARAIAELAARRPTIGRPFVMGFSQGGMLSYQLALHHPEVVELSLPMSGMLPESLWPAAKPAGTRFPRIFALHGDADEIVPVAPARALVARLRTLGYEAELREYEGVEHHITPAMEALAVELLMAHARTVH